MPLRFSLKYATVLVFCGVYIPFEDYIVYLLPVGSEYKIVLKQGTELILYLLLIITLMTKFSANHQLRYSPIDLLLVSFIGVAILGILINSASWMPAINNMRALLRYVAAYYIVFYNGLSLMRWRYLTGCMISVTIVALVMSIMQYADSSSVSSFIKIQDKIRLATDSELSIHIFIKDEKKGAVQGMFESPGTLGIFLFSVLVLFITRYIGYAKPDDYKIRIVIILVLILSFFTYSKSAFLLNLFTIGFFYFFFNEKARLPLVFIALVGATSIFITYISVADHIKYSSAMKGDGDAFSNISNLFSSEYWAHFFSAERGWVISEVAPQVIKSIPIIGYSSDPETAKRLIVANSDNLDRLLTYDALEDVYFVALLSYYGLIGLALFVAIFYVLVRCGYYVLAYAKAQNNRELAALSCAFLAMSSISLIYSFFERIFEVKVFSYYYWILAGTIARTYTDVKLHQRKSFQKSHLNNNEII